MLRTDQSFEGSNVSQSERLCTFLGNGSYIFGKLSFAGDANIEGLVIGDINAAGKVIIGEGGRVRSQLRASSVVISGQVTGDIAGSERIEIYGTATVFGNLTSPLFQIESGADLVGHLSTSSEQSSYDHQEESERAQTEFPSFKSTGIVAVRGYSENRPSDASRTSQRLETREVLARFRTIQCCECPQPIRWWGRRIWRADGERCAHLKCWQGLLFFKAFVADQIRCSQLAADESSALTRNGSTEHEPLELHAPGGAPPEPVERQGPGAQFTGAKNSPAKRAFTKISVTPVDVLHELEHLWHFLAPWREHLCRRGFRRKRG